MQPGATRVFLDSNVLLSRTLRDWFCLLSLESGQDGIALHWSEDVLAEFLYHRRRKNPHLSDQEVGGWRRKLDGAFPAACISGYSVAGEHLQGDPHDAHVIAAAIHGSVDYLVTDNVRDFERHADTLEFEIYSADDFLCLLDDRRPDIAYRVTKQQFHYWKQRPDGKSLPQALVDAGASSFAAQTVKRLQLMASQGDY